jgi:hypothetical protein
MSKKTTQFQLKAIQKSFPFLFVWHGASSFPSWRCPVARSKKSACPVPVARSAAQATDRPERSQKMHAPSDRDQAMTANTRRTPDDESAPHPEQDLASRAVADLLAGVKKLFERPGLSSGEATVLRRLRLLAQDGVCQATRAEIGKAPQEGTSKLSIRHVGRCIGALLRKGYVVDGGRGPGGAHVLRLLPFSAAGATS